MSQRGPARGYWVADRILVVDDDPLLAPILAKMTGKEPLIVDRDFVNNIEEMSSHPVRAIFLDIFLGTAVGLDLIPRLKELWPRVPILVMTSSPDEALIENALARGAHDFVRKPLVASEVRARLAARSLEAEVRAGPLVAGDLALYEADLRLRGPEGSTYLGAKEAKALQFILKVRGARPSKAQLQHHVWGSVSVSPNSVDQLLSRLRKAFAEIGSRSRLRSRYGGFLELSMASAQRAEGPATAEAPPDLAAESDEHESGGDEGG